MRIDLVDWEFDSSRSMSVGDVAALVAVVGHMLGEKEQKHPALLDLVEKTGEFAVALFVAVDMEIAQLVDS